MPWEPSADLADTWRDICRVEPRCAVLIESVVAQLAIQDASGWHEIRLCEHNFPPDYYLIRHGLPLAELAGWPIVSPPHLIDGLALHFWWECCWRHLDNLLDVDGPSQGLVATAAIATLRAGRLHQKFCGSAGISWSDEASSLLDLVCRTAVQERLQPIPRDEIWKRAAPFFIVPRTIFRFDEYTEKGYQAYINARGLAHDIDDLLSDLSTGIHSLPSSWLHEISDERTFRRDVIARWFKRAREELDEAIRIARRLIPNTNRVSCVLVGELESFSATLASRAGQADISE